MALMLQRKLGPHVYAESDVAPDRNTINIKMFFWLDDMTEYAKCREIRPVGLPHSLSVLPSENDLRVMKEANSKKNEF